MNKKFLFSAFVLFLGTFSFLFAETLVTVKVVGRGLIIGTPAATGVNLGQVAVGDTVKYTFDDPFWIKDLRGSHAGHYTTIQCNGLFADGMKSITGVKLHATVGTLQSGQPNETKINAALQVSGGADITEPTLYFYRVDGGNNSGVLNKYVDYPTIIIPIPEGTQTGTYKGRIVYTLYDLGFSQPGY